MLALSGCYSGMQDFDPGETAGPGAASGASDDAPAEPTEPTAGEEVTCDGGPGVSAAPMRRLTGLEYDNTIRDLLHDDSRLAEGFQPDEEVGGFAANSVGKLDKSQLDEYVAAAEELAHSAVDERWERLVGCDASGPGCVESFVEGFGRRAFRRPLSTTEQADYLELYEDATAEWGPTEGVAMVIQAMLLSPYFLYHVEPADEPGVQPVSRFALASRLSYFAWASMPDDELLDAAEAGELTQPEQVEQQIRRLLADERAAATITSFHRQWLHIQGLPEKVKDPTLFPAWNESLGQSMEQETLRFVDQVVRHGDGTLQTLLTAPWTVADATLAEHYGVPAPDEDWAVVPLPADERAGLLTHASFLTSTAHAGENSWAHRGKFVREKMLCHVLPPPPMNVGSNEPNDPSRLEDPNCNFCHLQMDPIGIGLDAYNPIGIFGPEGPDGETISTEGQVLGVEGLESFDGAVELATALAKAPQVHDCMAKQWFRYGVRRVDTEADACTLEQLRGTFAESGQDIQELMVAIALSTAFRYQLNE
ncbi:MAG: DUF1592 domain-containing protein [Myxococcota bacterium]